MSATSVLALRFYIPLTASGSNHLSPATFLTSSFPGPGSAPDARLGPITQAGLGSPLGQSGAFAVYRPCRFLPSMKRSARENSEEESVDATRLKKALLVMAAIAGAGVIAWCLFMVAVLVLLFGFGGGQFG